LGELRVKSNNKYCEFAFPPEKINKIYCKSSVRMEEVPDNSVHLIVASPPYNIKKECGNDLSLDEYRKLLIGVFSEAYVKLVVGRKPYIPLHSYLIEDVIRIVYL